MELVEGPVLRDDPMHFPAKHKVGAARRAVVEDIAGTAVGECQDPRGSFPVMTEQLTMVCHHI
jgi:hypothetical protein